MLKHLPTFYSHICLFLCSICFLLPGRPLAAAEVADSTYLNSTAVKLTQNWKKTAAISQLPQRSGPVYVIPIKGTIELGLSSFVERALAEAQAANARLVILDIDTPGGRVDAAEKAIDALLKSPVPVISFINRRAISAGAMIALATPYIIMAREATIGDVEPQPTSEKIVSYIRAKVRSLAEFHGRDPQVAAAMVDSDIEIPGLVAKGKLLTLTTSQAIKLGLASDSATDLPALLQDLGLKDSQTTTMVPNWAETIVRFITDPVVTSMLLSLGFLGLLMEFKTVGWGVAGSIGTLCLTLFFWGHHLVGLADTPAFILLAAGMILLLLEIFVVPGFGITGISGIVCLVASFVLAMSGPHFFPARMVYAANVLAAASLLFASGAVALFRFLPKTTLGGWVILNTTSPDEKTLGEDVPLTAGMTGQAETKLRPAGRGLINDQTYDVKTDGTFLEEGDRFEIKSVHGNIITVRKIHHDRDNA